MTQNSENRLVLITGAAGGLGSALTLVCASSGWETILVDKHLRGLEKLYDQVAKAGGIKPNIHSLDFESAGPQDCQDIASAINAGYGRLDALVHCAVSFEGLQPLDHIKPDEWMRQIQVNLNVPWLLSVSLLPLLRMAKQASLIFLTEDIEKVSGAYWGAYGVSKNAVNSLAGQFASELSNTEIQVVALNPGPIRTALRAKVYHSEDPADRIAPDIVADTILQLMERTIDSDNNMFGMENLT